MKSESQDVFHLQYFNQPQKEILSQVFMEMSPMDSLSLSIIEGYVDDSFQWPRQYESDHFFVSNIVLKLSQDRSSRQWYCKKKERILAEYTQGQDFCLQEFEFCFMFLSCHGLDRYAEKIFPLFEQDVSSILSTPIVPQLVNDYGRIFNTYKDIFSHAGDPKNSMIVAYKEELPLTPISMCGGYPDSVYVKFEIEGNVLISYYSR
jgi:hypothetical protein